MKDGLEIWTIYERPTDDPYMFIARKHIVADGGSFPTNSIIRCERIEPIRAALASMGLVCMMRDASDEPQIVESWF